MFSKLHKLVATSACVLIVFALPGGTAAQSLALFFVACAGIFISTRRKLGWRSLRPRSRAEAFAWLSYTGFSLWQVGSTLLNSKNPAQGLPQNFVGVMTLVLVPPWLALCWDCQDKGSRFWDRFATAIFAIWTLVCLSQAIFGWEMVQTHLEFSPHYERARGFYSHPLTLAYVLLAIWPLQLVSLWRDPRQANAWIRVIGIGVMVLLSGSRTVQICLLISLLWLGASLLQGRKRWLFLASLAAAALLLVLTPNPIAKRFASLIAQSDPDSFSAYPDDRLAFWHAFSGIVAERPFLGHGINLNRSYRHPYYAAIGLGDFPKQYEAHNQLLQILAEGGVIGLLLFGSWVFFTMRAYPPRDHLDRLCKQQTLCLLLLGGLSQNAFQDSEMRYALIILISLAQVQSWRLSALAQKLKPYSHERCETMV